MGHILEMVNPDEKLQGQIVERSGGMSINSWTTIQLPSLGRYYGDKCPDGVVQITPWTTAQEEMIVRHSSDPGKVGLFEKLLSSNLLLPNGMAQDDLIIFDQHFVLMKLRAISITAHYTVDFVCQECRGTSEVSYNLDELPVRVPDENESWDEPFNVKLPSCKVTVGFRHLRIRDVKSIRDYIEKKESSNPGTVDQVTFRLSKKIISLDGNEAVKPDEKRDFIRGLKMIDVEVFRSAGEEKELGIITETQVKCPRCRFVDKWDIPIQPGFFRPKRADIDAAIAMAEQS